MRNTTRQTRENRTITVDFHKRWLQVLDGATMARTGPGGKHQEHTQARRSEKCGVLHRSTRARYAPEARFFGPQTPVTQAAQFSDFSRYFNGLGRFTKLATSYILDLKQSKIGIGRK